MTLFNLPFWVETLIYICMGIAELIILGWWVYWKFINSNKLDLYNDPRIKKENYVTEYEVIKMKNEKDKNKKQEMKNNIKNKILEFNFDKKTDLIPSKWSVLTIIILSEDKGINFLYRKFDTKFSTFRFKKGKYIIENDGIYTSRDGSRIAVYIEGISVPLKSSYVEKITKNIKYTDLDGSEKITTVQLIKGLRFDSKIFDTFSNREFAEIFTKPPRTTLETILMIVSLVNIIATSIVAILVYYYR